MVDSMGPDSLRDREFRMLVDGALVPAQNGRWHDVVDPSTGRTVAAVPAGAASDVHRAVAAADRSQPSWQAAGYEQRSAQLLALAEAIEPHIDELAMLDAIDAGNPVAAMRQDVRAALDQLRAWPSLARWSGGETIPATEDQLHITSTMPYGVVGKILPYNHPALFAITRVVAPLLAGNTVVVKPGWQTPLSALRLGELASEVLPAGVLNIVPGGTDPATALVDHPQVRRIGFIGSVAVGRSIQQRAAASAVKSVTLELGGKNPMIVFPDAHLDTVVAAAIMGMNFTVCQGQSCGSTSRVFVHERMYKEFVSSLAEHTAELTVGSAYADGTEMGPLITAEHRERVLGFIGGAVEQGARVAGGGSAMTGPPGYAGGFYLQPTVLADVTPEMNVARDEVFGPVVSVLPWNDYETVISQANDTDFGLAASVWTHDLTIAHRTAERLVAGYVWVNDVANHYWGTPFGGMRDSGIGKEEGLAEYHSYLQTKVTHVALAQDDYDDYLLRGSTGY